MKHMRFSGFTLIELMIVVVIIGVLAAIAYPSYTKFTIQSRRSDAQIALTQAAALQEKYYSDCSYYAQSLGGAKSCGTGVGNGTLGYTTTSLGGYYTLTMAGGLITPTAACVAGNYACGYIITATPTGVQAGNGNLRIDSLGTKRWDKANNSSYSNSWTDK
jgi:type IV pilus assembly protein PilE